MKQDRFDYHDYPDRTRKGAMAIRQALDATLKKITLEEYAKDHAELAKALEKCEKLSFFF